MSECYGSHFIIDRELTPAILFNNSDVYEGTAVYEVVRMMNGLPLFFDDHMNRLKQSLAHLGKEMTITEEEIAHDLIYLKKNSGVKEANLKIVFNYKESRGLTFLLYFIEPLYPTHQQYREGVRTILYHAERVNPEIKLINHRLRSSIYHKLITESGYEALLVDNSGFITEGSRSNIFFSQGGKLYTAPDKKVLGGITRKHILDICGNNGIEVVHEAVHTDILGSFEAVFMTGTSPMVLPIRFIDELGFDVSDKLINRISILYNDKVKQSLTYFAKTRLL